MTNLQQWVVSIYCALVLVMVGWVVFIFYQMHDFCGHSCNFGAY